MDILDHQIENLLKDTLAKVGAKSIHELARYIPGEDGYCLNHRLLVGMKKRQPQILLSWIDQHILNKPHQKYPIRPRVGAPKVYLTLHQMSLITKALSQAPTYCSLQKLIPLYANSVFEKLLAVIRLGMFLRPASDLATKELSSSPQAICKAAMHKVKAKNEEDLTIYIPTDRGFRISYKELLAIKASSPSTYVKLINEHILNASVPKKHPWSRGKTPAFKLPLSYDQIKRLVATTDDDILAVLRPLISDNAIIQEITEKSMEKLQTTREAHLASYIPDSSGRRQLTKQLNFMKNHHPEEYKELLSKHILNKKKPIKYPRQRATEENVKLFKADVDEIMSALKVSTCQDFQDYVNSVISPNHLSKAQQFFRIYVK